MLKTSEGKKIKIIEKVAPKWKVLGFQLEFDEIGAKLDTIKTKNLSDPEECCSEMFQHWLKGNGVRPCSWRKLIELLEDCNFKDLAGQVNSVFDEK
jgi:NAD-specific glutamate dehydrogenase